MKRYMIEREIPGVGRLDRAQLRKMPPSRTACLPGFPEKYSGSTRSSRRTRHSASIWRKARTWFLSTGGRLSGHEAYGNSHRH
jgi:hypothetical protein